MSLTENKDPFEEFEFKPLTEGLGFQKRKGRGPAISSDVVQGVILPPVEQSTNISNHFENIKAPPGSGSSSGVVEDLILSLQSRPRPSVIGDDKKPAANAMAISDGPRVTIEKVGSGSAKAAKSTDAKSLLTSSTLNKSIGPSQSTVAPATHSATAAKAAQSRPPTAASTISHKTPATYLSYDGSAILLDTMLVLALNLSCLIALMLITEIDLFGNLMNPDPIGLIYLGLVAMVLLNAFVFLVGTRALLGFTPGEWVFDQRLGTESEFVSFQYLLKVMARSLLIVCTGFVVFPILGLYFGRDFIGDLTGVRLLRRF